MVNQIKGVFLSTNIFNYLLNKCSTLAHISYLIAGWKYKVRRVKESNPSYYEIKGEAK